MAIITSPGTRILDASGNPVNGGKFRVYEQNTTTLATLYSDTGMTTPRANPVVANSAGELPFFFLASNAYDTAQLDASDNVLDSQDDVPAWGEDTGDFTRTVSGSGRLKITGSAGTVLFQVGDPSADNSGGTAIFEGWAGTQADSYTFDTAAFNAGTTTGALKENSKKIIGVVSTEATTFTAASEIDIELTNLPTGCRAWEVVLFDVAVSAAAVQVRGRLSYDSDATYKSGAADYAYGYWFYDNATNTGSFSSSAAATYFDMTGAVITNTANRSGDLVLHIVTPDSGSAPTRIRHFASMWDADGLPAGDHGNAWGLGGYGRATHVRVYPSTGTFTGKYLVRPLRGYGET